MGLTTAMYTGLTGLNVNQTRIETIGNNIANVNTNAYRGSRTLFQTQFSQILSMGTPPGDASGGTNPMQIGHGAMVGSTQRTLAAGALETTGLPGDLAIEGAGYFVVRNADGGEYYTRDGAFALNSSNELVNVNGLRLRGFGVDENFSIVPGVVRDLTIPIGMQTIARASQTVSFDGDLSAAETVASAGAASQSQALVDGAVNQATADTALADLRTALDPAVTLFADGDTITISGITRGGRELPDQTFVVGTDGSTLGDFATWLQSRLGIQTYAGAVGNPGVVVENGALVVRSNAGEPLAIEIGNSDIRSTNAGVGLPFEFTSAAAAEGTGVHTSFTVYDSLGSPRQVSATFVLEGTPNTGPVWRYFLDTVRSDGTVVTLGTGTVTFDPEGNYAGAEGNQFALDLSGTGAVTPQNVTIDFSTLNGLSTQVSNVIMAEQDGYPPGTLTGYSVGVDGTITGAFSNGMAQTLGQVAIATFANEAGLVAQADNLFSLGPNSGPAVVNVPGTQGSGQVRSGALEMSNVDLAREFIGLITSSTAFQAASRVISTSNDMLDQLLVALR